MLGFRKWRPNPPLDRWIRGSVIEVLMSSGSKMSLKSASHRNMTMTVFGWLCAATSVALGAMYMWAAGAPQRYILVNAAALAVGLTAASFIRRVPVRDGRLA